MHRTYSTIQLSNDWITQGTQKQTKKENSCHQQKRSLLNATQQNGAIELNFLLLRERQASCYDHHSHENKQTKSSPLPHKANNIVLS
mmetsp:Transcript_11405/g.14087  ORF Transcript_11405/g.14087 Transcript_11405/m.14087 type:complete len:87 (+) Transcript_11405:769-1029(+)